MDPEDIAKILEEFENLRNPKISKEDSDDSKDSNDVKTLDSEILENSEDVKKTSDSEGSGDSGDSGTEYTDSEGAQDFEADILSALEEVYGKEGFELTQVKAEHNFKVFEISHEKSKAKISKNRAPITIFDHILIFTLLFVFAGILTVTGYSDDVFKWIHEKTGVSWQNFGGKNWIQ